MRATGGSRPIRLRRYRHRSFRLRLPEDCRRGPTHHRHTQRNGRDMLIQNSSLLIPRPSWRSVDTAIDSDRLEFWRRESLRSDRIDVFGFGAKFPVLRDWFNRFAWFWIFNSTNRFNREYVFSFDACASILQW